MEELQLEQILPTQITVNNRGAQRMTNTQQPTKCTRHVNMKEFVILQWTGKEKWITYENVPSALNPSESLSKPTGCTKFYEHRDILMGRRRPQYLAPISKHSRSSLTPLTETFVNFCFILTLWFMQVWESERDSRTKQLMTHSYNKQTNKQTYKHSTNTVLLESHKYSHLRLSAYAQLNRAFDFYKTSLMPQGTRVFIHKNQ
jgi:hypothetical protein